jgi:hypothetical protein
MFAARAEDAGSENALLTVKRLDSRYYVYVFSIG